MGVSPGMTGILETVQVMQRLARQGAATPAVREAAEHIVRSVPARDLQAEARAVESWIRVHLRYTRDGLDVETLKTPERMLAEIASQGKTIGDCDDAAVLGAALLLALGHAPQFTLLGKGEFPHHVVVEDLSSGRLLDPTAEPRGPWGYRRSFHV